VKKKGAHFVQTEWKGYSATKNFANSLSKSAYIFSLDADEALDKDLEKAILTEKSKGFSGIYSVNRLTNYCGKWIYHSGWYPDKKVRIFPKEKTKWVGEFVHEELEFSENFSTQELPGHLEHYSYYSYTDHRARADKYSMLTAQKMAAKGKSAGVFKTVYQCTWKIHLHVHYQARIFRWKNGLENCHHFSAVKHCKI
jgi:glycosyltransferase involved in cell wall biosynthesis